MKQNLKMIFGAILMLFAIGGIMVLANGDEDEFTDEFFLEECQFKTKGDTLFFPMHPGNQWILEGEEDEEELEVFVTVLNEKETIASPFGPIQTRVVEEREFVDNELVEVSRNFFAVCKQTQDIFYFGEDVDIYEDGEVVSHEGAWRAFQDDAMPGIIMPGRFLLGAKYFQEIAPNADAMDQAEHVEMGITIETEAGTFHDCVRIKGTTPLDPEEEDEKIYCPHIGIVMDEELELVEFDVR